MSEKLIFATVFTIGIIALSLLLFAGSAGAAPEGSDSKRTATGDLILAPDKIYLDPWYSGNSQDCARNMTLLKEGYMLSLDSLNFTSIQAKDGMWGKTIWIANFSLYKNGEVVKKAYLTHGDIIKEINLTYGNIFYYNKTIDGKEYTIIEAKLDAIFVTESCGTVLVILRPFYQYSDVTEGGGQEIPSSTADGGSPYEEWNMTFTGAGNVIANSVQQTEVGGYILAGETYNPTQSGWLVKTDGWGNEQWNMTFNDLYNAGYALAGLKDKYGALLIKVDEDGNEQWNWTFGELNRTSANSVVQANDGGYLLVGTMDVQTGLLLVGTMDLAAMFVKIDENGSMHWYKTRKFKGKDAAVPNSVQRTSDRGYIIAVEAHSYGGYNKDSWLIKTDENGNEQWNMTLGDAQDDEAFSVQQTGDGGYIVAGTTSFGAGKSYAWLRKVGEEQTGTATPTASPTETPIATPNPNSEGSFK